MLDMNESKKTAISGIYFFIVFDCLMFTWRSFNDIIIALQSVPPAHYFNDSIKAKYKSDFYLLYCVCKFYLKCTTFFNAGTQSVFALLNYDSANLKITLQ